MRQINLQKSPMLGEFMKKAIINKQLLLTRKTCLRLREDTQLKKDGMQKTKNGDLKSEFLYTSTVAW